MCGLQQIVKGELKKDTKMAHIKYINHWLIDQPKNLNVNGETSSSRYVSNGVFQGLIPGPNPFNIFISDLNRTKIIIDSFQRTQSLGKC